MNIEQSKAERNIRKWIRRSFWWSNF